MDPRKLSDSELIKLLIEVQNQEKMIQFIVLGKGKRNYTRKQKDFALSMIDELGVRCTARILEIPRRTIQRWCKLYLKKVNRCPEWVWLWARSRRKKREFWQRKGY